MDSIDWAEIARWFATIGLQIFLIIAISIVAYVVLSIASRVITRKIKQHDDVDGSDLDKQAETIRRLVKTSGTIVIVAVALLMIMDRLGLDIRPILASVGVVSLALGLGAQTLVKDVIGGIFIIMEGQFHIGDVIAFGGIVGTVEDMTLRATKVRDSDGTVHIIPNGELRIVSNRTRGWSRATVDITFPYDQDIEEVYQALEEVKDKASKNETIASLLTEELVITGVEGLDDWGIRVRITGKTESNKHWGVQRYLRKQVMEELASREIAVAQPWSTAGNPKKT